MTKRIKSLVLLFLFCICSKTFAQEYKVKAVLDSVPETGFYQILVSPELSAVAKPDFSDIRVMDSNTSVPYILRKKERVRGVHDKFISFPIIESKTEGNYAITIIKNTLPEQMPVDAWGADELSLIIKNAAVERYTSLSGSNDEKNWYIIDDHLLFHKADKKSETGSYVQTLSFPISRYTYFKLKINNAHNDPLNIISAGVFSSERDSSVQDTFMNPAPSFFQKDSNKVSYIFIRNNAPYLTDEVALKLTGPKYYKRDAQAFIPANGKDSLSPFDDPYCSFTIAANQSPVFYIPDTKVAGMLVTIDNKDNPPLKVMSVATSQEKQYIVAWLEKGKKYTLLADNPGTAPPHYDLGQFKDSIPKEIKTLTYGTLTLIPKAAAMVIKPTINYWLWPVIVLSVVVLGGLTFRLMKDVKKGTEV